MKSIAFRQEYTHEYLLCGGRVPWYYGLACKRYDMMSCVMYLIPFNFVVRYWINFLRYSRGPSLWDKLLQESYNRGREEGIRSEQMRTEYASKRLEEMANKVSRLI